MSTHEPQVGELVGATVSSFEPYGVWLTAAGHPILVLVTDISWRAPVDPLQLFEVGQPVAVPIAAKVGWKEVDVVPRWHDRRGRRSLRRHRVPLARAGVEYDALSIRRLVRRRRGGCRTLRLLRAESWRTHAFAATRRVLRAPERLKLGWCDGLAYLENWLLGYSEDQRTRWLEFEREQRHGWRGRTLYMLIGDDQLALLEPFARRCFARESQTVSMTAFYHREGWFLKKDAARRLPPRVRVARASVKRVFFREVFGGLDLSEQPVVVAAPMEAPPSRVNHALESSIQVFGAEGWE